MRVDNDGEGGNLAPGVAAGRQEATASDHSRSLGLFGSALIYGDGAITPAISVLSALEGLNMATPVFQPYILPAATVILIALFALQPQGTARIGRAFGHGDYSYGSLPRRPWVSGGFLSIRASSPR